MVQIIESNIDDMGGEWFGFLMDKLFQKGALDVWYTPIYMKKNRPAVQVSILCKTNEKEKLSNLLLEETTTLGVRSYEVERTILKRKMVKVDTSYGKIAIKIAEGSGISKGAPEYEDCKEAAERCQVPLRLVYEAAMKAFWDGDKITDN